MAELYPYPFAALVRRMFAELEAKDSIFDLPRKKWFTGATVPDRDLSVSFHGHRAATPLGPAAGPQSQMAQNIVLSWLAGCRIMELKTIQINDALEIPRPCIDMQTIGYNVEWSQELKVPESLGEYVKGMMLVEMLKASGVCPLEDGQGDTLYDMSVGYDLAGIKSDKVQAFIRGMLDASELIEQYRAEIPDAYAQYRDLQYPTRLSDTLTLSTFHGCPPDEIEGIIDFLLKELKLNCIVKLNPMLLGPTEVPRLLNEALGYTDVTVPMTAFERDTSWEQAQGFVQRLGDTAAELGLSFGVKFSNTLIVENHRDFFPEEEKEMYLSGQPLHVIAMNLVKMFRGRFGDRYPISFSAGIDRKNFADAVAIGLTPITVCSDFCRVGGYGRASGYFKDLGSRMKKAGAEDIPTFILRAYGQGEAALGHVDGLPEATRTACVAALADGGDLRAAAGAHFDAWLSAAKLLNTDHYVSGLEADARYSLAKNSKPPRKVGTMLELFDCISCDKCVPVCPNNANFTLPLAPLALPIVKLTPDVSGAFTARREGEVQLTEKHQIANYADFCNECGNCDIFCPEDGGPYVLKPRFFGSLETWNEFKTHDGFYFARSGEGDRLHGRIDGKETHVLIKDGRVSYSGDGFDVAFALADPENTVEGSCSDEVDLTYWYILNALRGAVFDAGDVNYVESLSRA